MRRTIVLLVLFLLLGGVAAWYLSMDRASEKSTVAGADREFAVEDISRIHRIFLARRDGVTTDLRRGDDGYWTVNGEGRANPRVMSSLLDAIKRVRMMYKPPEAAEESMVSELATHGVKVELYDASGDKIKGYYVGGAGPGEFGTFMILEDAEQPYVVELPYWDGNVSVRYSYAGDEWRDKALFRAEPEDIRSLSIAYPKQKNQSFRLTANGGDYEIEPYYDITPAINRTVQPGKVQAFLSNYDAVIAEAFRNNYKKQDSVRQQIPFSIITLVDTQGDTTQATFYPVVEEDKYYQDPESGEYVKKQIDFERYFVDLNGKDFLQIQQQAIQEIFWGYPSFFEEAGQLQ